ncbi:MAG TPA: peptide chain release factor N(5)-glutamine methyltransferase [Phycisphaerae bacterium]|nr:peptide chain release factor N(5)-glutamine methyltransferase [Phycisphaerae bacterium]
MSAQRPARWTVLRLLDWTKEHLARAGVEAPRLAAEVLLAHALGCRRIDVYTRFEYEPSQAERARFRELIVRAARHEPIAYLVGEKEFYSLRFKITPDVLVPRPETELLVAEAVAYLGGLSRPARMWDACTGSGCVAIAVAAQVPDVHVLATDISEPAVAVAAENAAAHSVTDRVLCRVANLLALPEDLNDWTNLDTITANPPYVADGAEVAVEVLHEPALALRAGPDGLDCIRAIVRDAPSHLRPGGALIMEFGYDQADAVRQLIIDTGAFDEPKIVRDHQHIERCAVAMRKE